MKIISSAVALPSRKVTNAEVVKEIRERSGTFRGDLERTMRAIEFNLRKSGADTRYWRADNERSIDLTVKACQEAMAQDDERIDLLIYASVFGELCEPSSANLLANELGLFDVECFDVKQACDGWSKAVQIASAFIEGSLRRRVMIVNAEFPMTPGFGIFPELFSLRGTEQLEHRFPGYTLGEAASAMILGSDPENKWTFHNKSRNDLYDLCTITMPWQRDQPVRSERVGMDGAGIFTSYGAELKKHGLPLVVQTFKESGISGVDILFTHSSSRADWRQAAKQIGLDNCIVDIYQEYGNVVSAAVPTALALAQKNGTLKRGQHVAALVASAGMSFTATSFHY